MDTFTIEDLKHIVREFSPALCLFDALNGESDMSEKIDNPSLRIIYQFEMERLIPQLPAKMSRVIQLMLKGKNIVEISNELEISQNSVAQFKHVGISRLREKLEKFDPLSTLLISDPMTMFRGYITDGKLQQTTFTFLSSESLTTLLEL